MFSIMHRCLIGIAGATLLPACLAQAGTAGWSAYGVVLELEPTIHGRFLLKMDLTANPSGCRDKDWFYRDYTGAGAEYMFQAALKALDTGKRVQVYVTGNCDLNGYSEISSLRIAP